MRELVRDFARSAGPALLGLLATGFAAGFAYAGRALNHGLPALGHEEDVPLAQP